MTDAAPESPIAVAIVPVTPFQQNCSLVWCRKTNRGAVVDPGGEVDRLEAGIRECGFEPEKILITHGHIDHAGGAAELSQRLDVPIEGPHRDDLFLIEAMEESAARWGLADARPFEPARWLTAGDMVTVGALDFEVFHCPGHTPGHVAYLYRPARLAFVGDVLFQGSIGRTDFPRGDHATLIRSIREVLFPLGDDIAFIPGHGEPSTFGDERRTNAFVGDRLFA
jgi:glyoxylase-like metal-dependent hydrolase (beta-lactamase superfamily II)